MKKIFNFTILFIPPPSLLRLAKHAGMMDLHMEDNTMKRILGVVALSVVAFLSGCSDDEGDNTQPPPAPGDELFVDGGAAAGGNGSQALPFKTLEEALAVEGATRITLLPGTYTAPAQHTFAQDLTIEGTGTMESVLIAPGTDPVAWQMDAALTVRKVALFVSLEATGTALTLEEITSASGGKAVAATGLEALSIMDATIANSGGLLLEDVAQVSLEKVSLSDIQGTAITANNTALTLSQVDIETTVALEDDAADGIRLVGGSLDYNQGAVLAAADRSIALTMGAIGTLQDLRLEGAERATLFITEDSQATGDDVVAGQANICVFVRGAGASLTLDNSEIGPCGAGGIFISDEGQIDVDGLQISDCGGGHLSFLGGGGGVVENSTLTDAAESCINISGQPQTLELRGNTISNCVGVGIGTLSTTGIIIEGNTLSQITPDPVFAEVAHGISLVDSQASIDNNEIFNTDQNGVSLLRSAASLTNNRLHDTRGAAISVVDPADFERTNITGNTITDVRAGGVVVFNAQANIADNTIENVAVDLGVGLGDGVVFAVGANAEVSGNTITGCANNGVLFSEGASGNIDNNVLRDNGQFGILEFCGELNDVELGENTFENNGQGDTRLCE